MALKLQEKKNIVSDIEKKINLSLSIITANYKYITVNKLYQLRKEAKKQKVIINVIKNNLLKIAIKKTSFSCLKKNIKGPTLIAFSLENPSSGARLFKEFSKKNKKFLITGAVFEKKLLNTEGINLLASMPTYEEAIIKLIILLKETAIGKFVRLLLYIKKIKQE